MTGAASDKKLTLRFAGYAGLFDIPDAAHDILRTGAFAKSLSALSEPLPLLWQHRAHQQIGFVEQIGEDARGLRVIARIDRPDSRAASMLSAGHVSGLSFGYRTLNANYSSNGRELLEVDLFEVSLVSYPLQSRARVHLVQ